MKHRDYRGIKQGFMLWVEVLWLVGYSCRALSRHFCWGSGGGPLHLNFQGPQAKFQGSLHWNTLPILPILGGPLGPQAKFHKGPIEFSGAWGPYLWALSPRALLLWYLLKQVEVWFCTKRLFEPRENYICRHLHPGIIARGTLTLPAHQEWFDNTSKVMWICVNYLLLILQYATCL